jgi:CBS domain-containing protein
MSSPVVTVPPGMRLKEVADLLVTRGISAVPVVDGGELVGIISEADLLPLELAPDPRAHLAPLPAPPAVVSRIAGEAMTRDVVVDLTGPPDPIEGRLATLLARGMPGVLEVRLDEE